uniref:Uncharacterized protein n=1 Tax=Noccaea caerulescens TaxID=107243 RepID=A0A1J3HM74_NOCCA
MLCIKVFEQHPSETSGSKDSDVNVSDMAARSKEENLEKEKLISERTLRGFSHFVGLALRVAEISLVLFVDEDQLICRWKMIFLIAWRVITVN